MLKKTLLLNKRQIEDLIDMRKVLRIVERAFIAQAKGKTQMPAKIYIHLDRYHGDFRAMPAYIEGMEACGIKWVSVHPENRRYNLPAVMAVVVLNEPRTGFPLAIMDGTHITNLRTGASGGVAAKYLARKDSSVVGLVGCGVQARTQLLALKELFRIKLVNVWGNKPNTQERFLKETRYLKLNMKLKDDIFDCVEKADIVVTTTPSRRPLVKREWIRDGTHINAIGADAKGKEELEPSLLKRAKIIVDDKVQAMHSGEINVPISKGMLFEKDIYATLGEILIGKKKGRRSIKEITIFDSTGIAICDVAVANYLYKEAIRNRTGSWVHL